ncbi:hypothetical protein Sjap_026110 [Stephania japonica]|uniref:Pentatricopeptide repeat-containing protein n=1 Tax=Stephania japonica TaxID=461633 RepID=A0AAP0E311_9MAGN
MNHFRRSTRFLNVYICSLCKSQQLEKAEEAALIDGIRIGYLPDTTTYNTLIVGYASSVGFDAAYSILHRVREAGCRPDVVSYNSLISSSGCFALLSKSLELFEEMHQIGEVRRVLIELDELGITPNVITYTTVMKCCFRHGKFQQGLEIFSDMKAKWFTFDAYAYCTVISPLIKIGMAKEANECIEQMLRTGIRLDLVSYNTKINLYCKQGNLEGAFRLIDEIEKSGTESDIYTYITLVDALCKNGDINKAQLHLKLMEIMGFKSNLVACNSLIHGLCQAGRVRNAMKVLKKMEMKDSFTYTSMVQGLFLRAVISGLRVSGYKRQAWKLMSEIRMASVYHYEGILLRIVAIIVPNYNHENVSSTTGVGDFRSKSKSEIAKLLWSKDFDSRLVRDIKRDSFFNMIHALLIQLPNVIFKEITEFPIEEMEERSKVPLQLEDKM